MSAATLPIHVEQGATFQRTLTITDAGVPVNLTGYTAQLQIRATVDSPDPLIDVDTSSGITITPLTGVIDIVISDTLTATLPIKRPILGPQPLGVWAINITSPTGIVERLLEGQVTISPAVIR